MGPKVDMYKWSYFFEQRTHNLVNGTQKISIDLLLKKQSSAIQWLKNDLISLILTEIMKSLQRPLVRCLITPINVI